MSDDSKIELYFIDKSDSDKLKLCGVVQSISELNEIRVSENKIDVNGLFDRIRLNTNDNLELFAGGFLHPKSQKNPFVAIHTDYKNNAKIIIAYIWFINIGHTFSTEDVFILENVKWEAESIKSEKLDGSPFTLNDAIEYLLKN